MTKQHPGKMAFLGVLAMCGAALSAAAQGTNLAQNTNGPSYPHDAVAYAIGAKYGADVSNLLERIEFDGDVNDLIRGFNERLKGTSRIADGRIREVLDSFQSTLQAKLSQKHHTEGDAFRAEYKKKPGVKETPSGILYEALSGPADGRKPGENDTVKVNYQVALINGKVCDSSALRGKPDEFVLHGVIRGWREALMMMPVGAKWKIVIPPDLAYGDNSNGAIGPGSTLIFEVELLDTHPPVPKTAVIGGDGEGSPIVMVPSAAELSNGVAPKILTEAEAAAIAAEAAKTNGAAVKPAAR